MSRYNIMTKSKWDEFKEMGANNESDKLEKAIYAIFAIGEYNRTATKPMLIPGSYLRPGGERAQWMPSISFPSTHPEAPFLLSDAESCPYAYNLMSELIRKVDKMSFDGYVIAGGAALNTVVGFRGFPKPDADFYPLYANTALTDQASRHNLIMVSYNRWLQDCEQLCEKNGAKVRIVSRGEHATTIKVQHTKLKDDQNAFSIGDDNRISSYQMIHRAYKSPEEVVVGFDQPCCKAFFDGTETYLTLDCALCVRYNINPVDWRCESPTHIKRALKYNERCFRWVVPLFPLTPELPDNSGTRFRFAGGIITMTKEKVKLLEQRYREININNPDEFPIPKHQSEYQSDYEPQFIDQIIRDGYELPTEESPDVRRQSSGFDNLRAAATDHPTYFVAYSSTIADFLKNKFVVDDYRLMIERQEYREYFLHRKRMMEIADEVNKIQARMTQKYTGGRGRKNKCMDGPRPHRFQTEQMGRYLELCNEAKMLAADYTNKVVANSAAMLERRKIVNFLFDNPGTQITASFNPVKRTSHADYWGKNAAAIVYPRIAWDQLTALCALMNRRVIVFVPRDVMKMIREELFRAYVSGFFELECFQ